MRDFTDDGHTLHPSDDALTVVHKLTAATGGLPLITGELDPAADYEHMKDAGANVEPSNLDAYHRVDALVVAGRSIRTAASAVYEHHALMRKSISDPDHFYHQYMNYRRDRANRLAGPTALQAASGHLGAFTRWYPLLDRKSKKRVCDALNGLVAARRT